jgi:hypothetical protein
LSTTPKVFAQAVGTKAIDHDLSNDHAVSGYRRFLFKTAILRMEKWQSRLLRGRF